MAGNKVHLLLEGIEISSQRDQEVKMEFPHATFYVEAQAGRTIYTESITQCAAIATFDRTNRDRTLCHAAGSEFTEEYFLRLAGRITPRTTVMIVFGTDWAPGASATMSIDRWKRTLVEAMGKIHKSSAELEWMELWQPDPKVFTWLLPATFAMRPDGGYGFLHRD